MKKIKVLVSILCISFVLPTHAFAGPQASQKTCSPRPLPGTVALTFDDGPSDIYTPMVLQILQQNNIKATFFMIGNNAKKNPQIVKEVVAAGHVVGNHSMTHPSFAKLPASAYYQEVVNSAKTISQISGQKVGMFRFPYGASNPNAVKFINANGEQVIPIGYCPQDYSRPGANVIAQRVLQNAQSGSIILLHDGPAFRQQTVTALPIIIQGLRAKGLGFSQVCV